MESFKDDKLAATLSALRPAPRAAFAAELDERVAAGFPRPAASSPWAKAIARVRATPPRRILLPVGGTALAALAAVTVISVGGSGGGTGTRTTASRQPPAERTGARTLRAEPRRLPKRASGSRVRHSAAEAEAASGAASSGGGSAGSAAEIEPSSSATGLIPFSYKENFDGSGHYARGSEPLVTAKHRDIERSAEMVLGTDPTEVGDDAAKVFAAVHSAGGIVLNSSVHDGSGESAARRQLRPADPQRQARRRARRLLPDRRSPLPPRGDQRHHRPDGRRQRTTAGLQRQGREPADPAGCRRKRRRARSGRSRAGDRAAPRRLAALAADDAAAPGQLLPRLAPHQDRQTPLPPPPRAAAGASATPSTTPARSSPSPPASRSSPSRSSARWR